MDASIAVASNSKPAGELSNDCLEEAPKILQECTEGELDAMLAEQRPCHYAIANGHHVLWVPKHVPCFFEQSTGRLVVEVGHNARWLAPLHNPRSPLLAVPVGAAVGVRPSRRWVPELRFPRREPWTRAQALELDFSKVAKSECCPLARVRIYTEELRSLREALQVMVERRERGVSSGNGKGSDSGGSGGGRSNGTKARSGGMEPIAESAPAESTTESASAPQPIAPSSLPTAPATPVRSASPRTGCACFPGLRRRSNSGPAQPPPPGVLHVAPCPSAGSEVSSAAAAAPTTPQQRGPDQRQKPAAAVLKTDSSCKSETADAAVDATAGAGSRPATDQALLRGSSGLSSVDEAEDDTAIASVAELRSGEGRAGSGDSVTSMAGSRKPGPAKTLAWGDSARESPLSTAAMPSTAASSLRGDSSGLGSPISATAGPSTATSSQRGSGDSGSHRVFFGLDAPGSGQAGQRVSSRPELGSASTTAASSRRPSGEAGEVSADSIWSSKGSSRGSNEALVERASNFKRSLEAAQYAFYRDISPEAAAAAGGIEVNPPAAKAAVPQTTTGQLRKRAEVQAPESSAAAAVGASAEAPGETGAPAGADKPSEATLPGGATAAAAPAAVTVTAAEVALTAKTEAGAGRPEKRRRAATGASLPDLLLQTAQAVSSCPEPVRHRDSSRALGGPAAQQAAARERLGTGGRTSGGLKVTHSDGYLPRFAAGGAAQLEIWDTARGPEGEYWDVPRATRKQDSSNNQQPGTGNASKETPISTHTSQGGLALAVQQQAFLIAESKRSCEEVWAPRYESSPEGSSDEEGEPAGRPRPAHGATVPAVLPAAHKPAGTAGAVPQAPAQRPGSASSVSAAAAAARPAVAESPFRPRPPKQGAGARGNAAAQAPQQRPGLRPKRLFQSPPPGGEDGMPQPDQASRPDDPVTPPPSAPRTAQRDTGSGKSSDHPGPSAGTSSRAATEEFCSLPATPKRGDDAQQTPMSAEEQQPTSAAEELPVSHDSDMATASPLQTPWKVAGTTDSEDSPAVWLSSGLYASSSNEADSSSNARQILRDRASAAGMEEPVVAVKLKVAKPRATGFVASAIAALGFSSPAMQRTAPHMESVSLSVTPLSSPQPAKKSVALSPDLFDATWFTGRLAAPTSAAPAQAATAQSGPTPDRVAAAAARLAEAAAAESAPTDVSTPAGSAGDSRDANGISQGAAAPANAQHPASAGAPPGASSEEGEPEATQPTASPFKAAAAAPRAPTGSTAFAAAAKGGAALEVGSGSEGSPRPPGLLYKPELRSVAERVQYIERRSKSRPLDSPRSVASSRNGGSDSSAPQASDSTTPSQGMSSALTSALRAGSLKDTVQPPPQPPKPSTAGTALAAAGRKESTANDCSKAALPAGITATQRSPSFNTWTEDDA